MSYSHRFITGLCLLFATQAHALGAFVDGLYWRATETVDWAYTNNLSVPNQQINYQTVNFDYKPGFRLGVGHERDWYTKLYYTYYYTNTNASVTGNVVSAFLGGKTVQAANNTIFFYTAGQIHFKINYQIFDWDLGKSFYPTSKIMLRPLVGLRGGWINQTINTSFQGSTSVNEYVKNNFKGLGPKAAIESAWTIYQHKNYKLNIFGDFTSAYLWGKWDISDTTYDSAGLTMYLNVGNRKLGAFVLQAFMGVNLDFNRFRMKLGYEIADWFNQYQVLDDGTGARNVDLILQGLTLRLSYCL